MDGSEMSYDADAMHCGKLAEHNRHSWSDQVGLHSCSGMWKMSDVRTVQEMLGEQLDKLRPSTEVARFADVAMYQAEPMVQGATGVSPRVTLISATPRPLQAMGAAVALYAGRVKRDVFDVSPNEAATALDDMTKTTLKAGLEFVDFHFFIEGVTRAFTHQLVRQRTAVYIQESMRFAVKDNAAIEVATPPSLQGLKEDDPRFVVWRNEVIRIAETYSQMINGGVPAEDARGLLPTNITTRVHYKTSLRGLMEHAGLRLCTQAQFEWRQVWNEIVKAIFNYETPGLGMDMHFQSDNGQFRQITKLFQPICYRTGKCEFNASVDRYCRIRERVQAHAAKGESSKVWVDISPAEWMLDPNAARSDDA